MCIQVPILKFPENGFAGAAADQDPDRVGVTPFFIPKSITVNINTVVSVASL
jgi:hypothetical protein